MLIRSFFDKDLATKISDKNEQRFNLSEVVFKFYYNIKWHTNIKLLYLYAILYIILLKLKNDLGELETSLIFMVGLHLNDLK